jgi:16S rRNA (cytosine1402-N4)-methyltransferase
MKEVGGHQPVMLQAVLDGLDIKSAGVYVDGTYGRGGHSGAILARLGGQGRLLAMDKDPEAVQAARERHQQDNRFEIKRGSFAMLESWMRERDLIGGVDGVLLDLGVSSPQLDDPARGFSFMQDGPLDMRMDTGSGESAADWLAHADAAQIAEVLKTYGEERYAKRIARAIVAAREIAPIRSTAALSAIVTQANPAWEKHKHPATRSFQAIRIHINRELDDLADVLAQSVTVLAPGGRLAVISFHSLEDRLVKRFMRDQSRDEAGPRGLPPPPDARLATLRTIGRAVHADDDEVSRNPRARSAVLRVAERLH